MGEAQDNIINILKSIPVIKHNYSKKNKEFDKAFKNKSLEYLLKKLDYHPKIHDEYMPSSEFLNHRNQYDINFQNSVNYIKEYSDLNNLPLVKNNRNFLKNGAFNPDYEYPIKNKEEQKSIILEKEKRKKEWLQKRINRLKNWRQNDSNIDPGKYHPNYDFIRKKISSVYIRQPAVIFNKKLEENEKNYDKNQNIKIKDNEIRNKNFSRKNTENNKNSFIYKNKENNNNRNGNDYLNNKSINLNNSHSLNDISSIKKKPSKYIIRNVKKKSLRLVSHRNIYLLDKNNSSTLSDYNYSLENNKSTNIEDLPSFQSCNNRNNSVKSRKNHKISLPKIGMRNIKNIRPLKYKKNRYRSSSLGNLKNPIIFKKMLGRDDILFGNQNLNLISYFPNYESMMPHIPSTIFKYIKNPQNYKKYITGKIIRGYKYSPEKYFVFEYEKNKVKKINMKKEIKKIKEILKKKVEN